MGPVVAPTYDDSHTRRTRAFLAEETRQNRLEYWKCNLFIVGDWNCLCYRPYLNFSSNHQQGMRLTQILMATPHAGMMKRSVYVKCHN